MDRAAKDRVRDRVSDSDSDRAKEKDECECECAGSAPHLQQVQAGVRGQVRQLEVVGGGDEVGQHAPAAAHSPDRQ
jgi:hypothetical protein